MNRHLVATTLLAATMAAAPATFACGEGQFSLGKGLRYQTYLAPRPASVLVYDADPASRHNIYLGLHRAGHHLTVARDPGELAQALKATRYDVVISPLEQTSAFGADPAAHLLPVVQRQQRDQPDIRQRFHVFLLDGASLGQYLKGIDQLVRGKVK
jgi:CheY-like chemotaxis protein